MVAEPDRSRVLNNIAQCDDPTKLRQYMKNARQRGADDVYHAAFHQLISVQPSAQLGTVAHDVWRTIYAFEELLKEERGKTVRLSRTRQKIRRDGEVKTVTDLTLKAEPSAGFHMLKDRGILELSFEALVVARADHFPNDVVDAASDRLESHGVDFQRVKDYWCPRADD